MELAPTEDKIVFSDGAFTLEEIYSRMSPTRLLDEMYNKQIRPIRSEHTSQMIMTRLPFCDVSEETAKRAVLEALSNGVEAGEIDSEMAEIAKEEFRLIGLVL